MLEFGQSYLPILWVYSHIKSRYLTSPLSSTDWLKWNQNRSVDSSLCLQRHLFAPVHPLARPRHYVTLRLPTGL